MNNFMALYIGELKRMRKYHILTASIISAFLFIAAIHFLGTASDVETILPLFIYADAVMMSMLMIGVTMFFEKQEGVIKSFLISPITKLEYIGSKIISNITLNIITLLLIYLYAFINNVSFNVIKFLIAVVIIAIFHSLIGFILTYYTKSFTDMLMGMMKYTLILAVPIILDELNVFNNVEWVSTTLYAIPTKASFTILVSNNIGNLLYAFGYLIIGSALIFGYVYYKFDDFAVKESGA